MSDVRCPNDGEMTNVRCWKCGWVRDNAERGVSAMDELIGWLRAQLDDDERKVAAMQREATRARTAPIFQAYPPNWLTGVDIFVSPTRWQDEIDAKRRILDEHPRDDDGFCADGVGLVGCKWAHPCPTLRLLALPFPLLPRPGLATTKPRR